jgi:hypothetical protein
MYGTQPTFWPRGWPLTQVKVNDVDENNVTALRFAGKLALSRYLAAVEATRVSG